MQGRKKGDEIIVSVVVLEGSMEAEEDIEEEEEAIRDDEIEFGGDEKEKEMAEILKRLRTREKKEKAASLVSKLRGKKKANKKIMPYEIYATSGE